MRRLAFLLSAAALSACSSCTPGFRDCPPPADEQLATLPDKLSQTGLFSELGSEGLAPGVLAYQPRFELWSDGASKRRWISLPAGTRIDTTDPDAWIFPRGTKLWKEFTRDGKRVETRLLFKYGEEASDWTMAAYVWTGRDAALALDGSEDVGGTAHDVPSAAQCPACHGGTQARVLGFSALQLPERGSEGGLGLRELVAAGHLTSPVPPVSIPGDDTARAALGYLHANCSHCHGQRRPPRSGPRCFDPERSLDFTLRTGELAAVTDTATYRTALGSAVVPGSPDDSDVMRRIRSRDAWWGMPALGSELVDEQGAALLERWIRGL